MIKVFVEINGIVRSTEISEETHERLRTGSLVRNRPVQWFLRRIVNEYGDLTEKSIKKFMDEKWIF